MPPEHKTKIKRGLPADLGVLVMLRFRHATRRSGRLALAIVGVSLLLMSGLAVGPAALAAPKPSITITADQQTVKAGDQVTLKIKLQNVTNATLNGAALPGGKNSVEKKVLVCVTTTYTVAALPTDGGPKISQALTITASGTSTKAACASPAPSPLPDLVVTSLTMSQSYDPKRPDLEMVHIDYTIENRGQAPAAGFWGVLSVNGKRLQDFKMDLKAGEKLALSCDDYRQGQAGEQVTYSVLVDSDNTIVESDKTNNTRSASIIVLKDKNSLDLSSVIQPDELQLHDPKLSVFPKGKP
jgi:hypothetical protein